MENASCRTVTTLGSQPNIKLVVLDKPPISENGKYQKFLDELQSYGCGYWRWLRKRRIREVFIVDSIASPETGKIDKASIKRKTADFIELLDYRRFDIKTGRSLYGQPRFIFPVENRRVWEAWEPQSLRDRVERVLPRLRFNDLRAYADIPQPNWHFSIFSEKHDRLFGRNDDCPAGSLSESEEASIAKCRKLAKEAVLGHMPQAIQEFRALVEMMERDAKR